MKKIRYIATLCLVIALITLAGCTRQEYSVNINDQNNVEFEIKVLISRQSYELLSSFGIDINELNEKQIIDTGTGIDNVNVLFQETAMLFYDYGFNIQPLDDAVDIGFSAKKSYLTIEEFNAEIQQLVANNLSGLYLDIQYVNTNTHKEYKAYGTINYLIDPDMGLDDESIKQYFDRQYDSSDMTAKVTINMPLSTQITNYDGTPGANNGGIVWNTSYKDGQKDVHIISSYSDNTMYYAIGFVVFIIVLVIGFFAMRALKFKKEKMNSALAEEYAYEKENKK